jgi:hypothetical protein
MKHRAFSFVPIQKLLRFLSQPSRSSGRLFLACQAPRVVQDELVKRNRRSFTHMARGLVAESLVTRDLEVAIGRLASWCYSRIGQAWSWWSSWGACSKLSVPRAQPALSIWTFPIGALGSDCARLGREIFID